jgi:hypothetical protein
MKQIAILSLILCIWMRLDAQKGNSSSTTIELFITSTSQYCGGAQPSQDMLDMLAKPEPMENKVLFVRKNTNDLRSKILYTITTNVHGRASLKLPPGKYSFVDASKRDIPLYDSLIAEHKEAKNQAGPIDPKCLLEHMTKSDFEVIIPKTRKKRVMKVGYNYFHSCNWAGVPCAEFRGQYPP